MPPVILADIPIFKGLSETELEEVLGIGQTSALRKGTILCRESDPADSFFVLIEGQVQVWKKTLSGKPQKVGVIQAPAVIGEMAVFLDQFRRTATVTAVTDVQVVSLSLGGLKNKLLDGRLAAFKVTYAMARQIAQRLNAVNDDLARRLEKEEIEGAGGLAQDLASLSQRLLRQSSF